MNIIKEFEKVRDIPYRIPLSLDEPNECCSGKTDMLFQIFKDNGYEVRRRLCTFRWSDLNLPSELKNMPHDDDASHVWLEAKIEGEWKIIDATWDKKLKNIFHVNEWDGKSDTEIAVPAIEILSPEKSLEYLEHISTPQEVDNDFKLNKDFYRAVNGWLESVRE